MTEPSSLSKLADDVVREMYSSLPTQWDRDCLRAKVLTALNAALRAAPAQGEPMAFVPIHPRHGPLWSDTYATGSEVGRSKHYEKMPLYAALPSSPAPHESNNANNGQNDSVLGAGEAISPADLSEVLENVRAGIEILQGDREFRQGNCTIPIELHRACQALTHMTKGFQP